MDGKTEVQSIPENGPFFPKTDELTFAFHLTAFVQTQFQDKKVAIVRKVMQDKCTASRRGISKRADNGTTLGHSTLIWTEKIALVSIVVYA